MIANQFGGFKYTFSESAKKDLKKLDKFVVKRIADKLDELVAGKDGLSIKMLVSPKHPRYRLRVGDYRIVFEINKNEIIIIIIGVGHRKEIYKKIMTR
jgi:mRNA interferase RelE/StbE